MLLYTFLILITNLALFEAILQPLNPSEMYTNWVIMDENNYEQYHLYWKVIKDEIQFEIHCKTTGWVGFGISPTGLMTGSDIAIGWVRDGNAYLKDCFATSQSRPLLDAKQNLVLLEGAEIDGFTILKFKRKILACDDSAYDLEIPIGNVYLITAWNDVDPLTGNGDWGYHQGNKIRNGYVLLNYRPGNLAEQISMPIDTTIFDIKMPNVLIQKTESYYHCFLTDVKEFDASTHLIQFQTLLNDDSKDLVNTVMLYECDDNFTPTEKISQSCGGNAYLPNDVSVNCEKKLIYVWGRGADRIYRFPKEAGYRFNPTIKSKYLLLKINYDNGYLEENIKDSTGIRLYFTKTLRKYDIGLLTLGIDEYSKLAIQIPPKTSNMQFTTTCHPECSQKYIPDDGIYIVSGLTQTFSAGKTVKTSLARNGNVIKNLINNPNFASYYQNYIDIEPTKISKGDVLITQCTYNTNYRSKFTYLGYSVKSDETCANYVYYYPKLENFMSCSSMPQPESIYKFYRSLMKDGLIPTEELDDSLYYPNMKYMTDFFNTKVKSNETLVTRFKEFFSSNYNQSISCGGNRDFILKQDVPRYQAKDLVEPKKCSSVSIYMRMSILISAFSAFILIVFL